MNELTSLANCVVASVNLNRKKYNLSLNQLINWRASLIVDGSFKERKDVISCSRAMYYWSNPDRYKDYLN